MYACQCEGLQMGQSNGVLFDKEGFCISEVSFNRRSTNNIIDVCRYQSSEDCTCWNSNAVSTGELLTLLCFTWSLFLWLFL